MADHLSPHASAAGLTITEEERAYRKSAFDPHDVVADRIPLREVEKALKDMFIRHTDARFELPHRLEDIQNDLLYIRSHVSRKTVQMILQSDLQENSFFEDHMDAAVYQHMRYLPAYWHSHDFFEVACVFWGKCTNYILDKTLDMKDGDICVLSPGTRHALSAFHDDCLIFNLELRTSTFEEAFFGTLEDTDILSSFFRHALYGSPSHPYLLFHTAGDYELYDYLLYALDELSANHLYKRRMVNNIIMAFFTILLRKHGDEVVLPDIHLEGGHRDAIYLLQYMQEHYATVTLSELAKFFNYSERQVQRLIKDLTGKSFSQNIQEMKLKRAADLIAGSDRPITELIQDLGYSDAGSFRNLFKKRYGMTPSGYRHANEKKDL